MMRMSLRALPLAVASCTLLSFAGMYATLTARRTSESATRPLDEALGAGPHCSGDIAALLAWPCRAWRRCGGSTSLFRIGAFGAIVAATFLFPGPLGLSVEDPTMDRQEHTVAAEPAPRTPASSQTATFPRVSAADVASLTERSAEARARAAVLAHDYSLLLIASLEKVSLSRELQAVRDTARESLHLAVGLYATLLKEANTSPERTLRLVKETVTEQISHPSPDTEPLMNDVVHWVIEVFYGAPPAA